MKQFSALRHYASCFLAFIFYLLSVNCIAQYYSAKVYKEEPGMTSNRIYDMVQFFNGEMWFATQEGINTYDGLKWKSFPDTLRFLPYSGYVRMLEGPDSSIYLLGVNNKDFSLRKYKNNVWQELPLPLELEKLIVPQNFELALKNKKGTKPHVLISYISDLYEYDGSSWAKFAVESDGKEVYINHILTHGDSVVLATDQGLLLHYKDATSPLYTGEEVYNFDYDSETGNFFLLGRDWLGIISDGKFTKLISNNKIGLGEKNPITYMHKEGNKLYYSHNSPMYSYNLNSGKQQVILSNDYNMDYTCMQGYFDEERNLWVATMRGAFKVSNLDIYSYNKNQLVEDEVSAILEASNGDIFLGNNFGFNILKPDGEIITHQVSDRFLQHRIMDIVEFNNEIFLAGHSAGVIRYRQGKLDYELVEGNKSRALDLHVYDGRLYAAISSNVYERTSMGWKFITSAGELPNGTKPIIRKIFWTDQHRLLLTPSGVYNCNTKSYYTSHKLDETNVYTGIEYLGSILLGTAAGVTEIKNNQIVVSTSVQDPLKQPVYSFLIDNDHRLWVGTERGIFHKSKYYPSTYISKANGLIGNEINRNAFVQLRDGRMMIGTDEGLSIYTPNAKSRLPVPQVELTGITRDGEPLEARSFVYSENQLRFHFRGISFYDESLVNYRIKLSGYDAKWQYLPYPNQRSATYTNLQPGDYRFLVQARVSDGEWSAPVHSGVINIKAAFYDTQWFNVMVIGIIVVLIFLLVRLRNQHLKQRNYRLEEKINDKTRALHEQNLELIRTITELKNTQGQLIQSEKLASMGHLTAGIAHEMNNPLNYIRGGAECLKQNLDEIYQLYYKRKHMLNGEAEKLDQEYNYLISESKQLIDSILNGAEKSTHIVKSLSSFTADAQNFYSFVELENEVNTALTLLNNQIGFRITINKFFGNVPRLECYPAKINQMLVNLLLNAIQAIPEEGEITIRIYRKDIKHLALEIIDTGEGIEIDDEEKVYEPFFTTKDNNPGLGLTIVKSIIQDHHGQVHFMSQKGRGTKVRVVLPLQQTFHPELEYDTLED